MLAHAGRKTDYVGLERRTSVVDGHTTFADLARAAGSYGVTVQGYRLTSPSALSRDDLGVVELTADHFVAFVGRDGDRFLIVDSPDEGLHDPTPWSAARLESEWTGSVLLIKQPSQN